MLQGGRHQGLGGQQRGALISLHASHTGSDTTDATHIQTHHTGSDTTDATQIEMHHTGSDTTDATHNQMCDATLTVMGLG